MRVAIILGTRPDIACKKSKGIQMSSGNPRAEKDLDDAVLNVTGMSVHEDAMLKPEREISRPSSSMLQSPVAGGAHD